MYKPVGAGIGRAERGRRRALPRSESHLARCLKTCDVDTGVTALFIAGSWCAFTLGLARFPAAKSTPLGVTCFRSSALKLDGIGGNAPGSGWDGTNPWRRSHGHSSAILYTIYNVTWWKGGPMWTSAAKVAVLLCRLPKLKRRAALDAPSVAPAHARLYPRLAQRRSNSAGFGRAASCACGRDLLPHQNLACKTSPKSDLSV